MVSWISCLRRVAGLSLALAVVVPGLAATRDAAAEAPPAFRDLWNALSATLASFEGQVEARWNGTESDVAFSAELLTANANRGSALLNASAYDGVLLELGRFRDMGMSAVTASLGFPILDPAFHGNASAQQAYLGFYKRLAADVRGMGLRLIVDAGVLFPTYVDLPVGAYYQNLTYAEFGQRRVDMIVLTARELAPDFLGFGSEPDTEASLTGFPVDTPAAYTAFSNAVVENVTAAGLATPLGAGVGTWDPLWREYATSYAQNTSLDFLDLHVYPVNFDFLGRLWDLAAIARAGGKDVGIGEAWLYKARDSELSAGVYFDDVFARDAYDFWAPLDGRFLWDMVNYSHAEDLAFLSPYWSKYFHAYLPYAQAAGMTYAELQRAANAAAAQAMVDGVLSEAGRAYASAVGGEVPTPPRSNPGGFLLVVLVAVVVIVVLAVALGSRRGRVGPPVPPPPPPPTR